MMLNSVSDAQLSRLTVLHIPMIGSLDGIENARSAIGRMRYYHMGNAGGTFLGSISISILGF